MPANDGAAASPGARATKSGTAAAAAAAADVPVRRLKNRRRHRLQKYRRDTKRSALFGGAVGTTVRTVKTTVVVGDKGALKTRTAVTKTRRTYVACIRKIFAHESELAAGLAIDAAEVAMAKRGGAPLTDAERDAVRERYHVSYAAGTLSLVDAVACSLIERIARSASEFTARRGTRTALIKQVACAVETVLHRELAASHPLPVAGFGPATGRHFADRVNLAADLAIMRYRESMAASAAERNGNATDDDDDEDDGDDDDSA